MHASRARAASTPDTSPKFPGNCLPSLVESLTSEFQIMWCEDGAFEKAIGLGNGLPALSAASTPISAQQSGPS
jgi:hypothetical protein